MPHRFSPRESRPIFASSKRKKTITTMKQISSFVQAIANKIHSVIGCPNSKTVLEEQLPVSAQLFVQNHFRGKAIASAERYNEVDGKYDVNLKDGTFVSFDSNGSWSTIQCQREAIPMMAVPIAISLFVKSRCPAHDEVRIDKVNDGYAVQLYNDVTYIFNKNGLISNYNA